MAHPPCGPDDHFVFVSMRRWPMMATSAATGRLSRPAVGLSRGGRASVVGATLTGLSRWSSQRPATAVVWREALNVSPPVVAKLVSFLLTVSQPASERQRRRRHSVSIDRCAAMRPPNDTLLRPLTRQGCAILSRYR